MEQTHPELAEQAEEFLRTGRVGAADPAALAEACDRHISERSRSSLDAAQGLARQYAKKARSAPHALRLSANRVLARISHMNSRHAEAEKAYLAARALARTDALVRGRIDRALVDVYMYLGDVAQSRRRAAMALRVFAAAQCDADVAMTKVNLANVLHRQDRHREAERLYREAAEFFEQAGNEPAVARCYYNRANTLVQLFEMEEAERLYRESFRLYDMHSRRIDATDARYGLAWLYMLQGKFHVALTELAACEETYREAGQYRGAALCELDRAEVFLGLNLLVDAHEAAVTAEGQFRRMKLRYETSKAAFFRAKAAHALGKKREAKSALERAQRGFAADRNEGFSGAAHFLAARMAEKGAETAEQLRKARRKFSTAQLPLWQAFCDVYGVAYNPGDSAALKRLAGNKAAQAVPHLYAQWQTLLGDRELRSGRETAAREHWQKAADRLDTVRAQLPPIELRTSFGRNLDSPHRRLIDVEMKRDPQRGAAWVERYKTAGVWAPLQVSADGQADRRRVTDSLAALAEQVAALSTHLALPGERGAVTGTSPALTRLHRLVRQELARVERSTAAIDPVNRISRTIAEVSRKHPVVQFYLTEADLVAFVHEDGRVRVQRWPGGRAQVETTVRRLRFYLEKQLLSSFWTAPDSSDGEERFFGTVGDWLWSPLEIAAGSPRVLIIPDGDLSNLPWSAIRADGRPLLERHQFVLAPSIRHHVRAGAVRPEEAKIEIFVGRSEDLPEVRRELDVFRGVDSGAVTMNDPSTRGMWPSEGAARLWHFTGHAVFRADNPFYSYLSMADGPMFAADFRLRQVQVGLVTLAACRSGEQAAMPGEESIGLVRSLLEMGARNVIAGHWPVADASTAQWMTTFYDTYFKGATLHDAMAAAAHEVRERYRSAYHWAAFSLFGAGN